MQLERTRVDGREYWVLRDDNGIAAMAESREAVLPQQSGPSTRSSADKDGEERTGGR